MVLRITVTGTEFTLIVETLLSILVMQHRIHHPGFWRPLLVVLF